jgi:hypothetical protein
MYYNVLGNTFPPPYMNVPQTFTKLESVPEGNGFPTSWHTIEAGEVAIYTAHKEIRLRPGFRAKAGSYFRAHIEPCYGCNEMQSSSMLNNPTNEDDISEGYNDVLPLKQGYATASTVRLPEEATATIRLYPNPSSGTFTLVPNFDPKEIETVQIYNSFGQLIHSQQGLPQATLTLPALSKGLFMLKITAATNQFILKMVVQ